MLPGDRVKHVFGDLGDDLPRQVRIDPGDEGRTTNEGRARSCKASAGSFAGDLAFGDVLTVSVMIRRPC